MNFEKAEKHRILTGPYASKKGDRFGAFRIFKETGVRKFKLQVICAPEDEVWQHVSVSKKNETPSWFEMCYVKNMFWGPDVCVVQFHPKKSEYVNIHNHCLHMWHNTKTGHETPQSILV